jgi:hypothetical protein
MADGVVAWLRLPSVTPSYDYKGQSWATEHYGIFQPEVPIEGDRYAGVNYDALKLYEDFDLILVSGQAAGNCVRRSVRAKLLLYSEPPPTRCAQHGTAQRYHVAVFPVPRREQVVASMQCDP